MQSFDNGPHVQAMTQQHGEYRWSTAEVIWLIERFYPGPQIVFDNPPLPLPQPIPEEDGVRVFEPTGLIPIHIPDEPPIRYVQWGYWYY